MPKKYDLCLTSSSRVMDPCICLIGNNIFGVAKDEYLIAIDPKVYTEKDKKQDLQKKAFDKMPVLGNVESRKSLKPLTWSQPLLALGL